MSSPRDRMPAGMKTKPYLLAIGCLCATLAADGQGTTLLIPSSSVDLTIAPYQDRAEFTFSTPSVSLANYNAVQVTFNAPPGYAWRMDPSIGVLECYASYGAQFVDAYGGSLGTFAFVPGMASTVTDSLSDPVWTSSTAFGFDHHYQFGNTVEFTALTLTVGYAVLLSDYEAQAPLAQFTQAYFDGQSQISPALTLVPIPEPSVAALNVLMLACAGIRFNLI